MLSVDEALQLVLDACQPLPIRQGIPLIEALGATLAVDIQADQDSPPFDKSLVDGFALRSEDLEGNGPFRLQVVDEITAGQLAKGPIGPGQCASIMTGAPMPEGADAVIMVEHVERPGPDQILVDRHLSPGANRLLQGREMRAGTVVLHEGEVLNPASIGVLANVGRALVDVRQKPSVVVVPTGDELVPFDQTPGLGQIRESHAITINALIRSSGFDCQDLPIVPDTQDDLRRSFQALLNPDSEGSTPGRELPEVILVCGGVSAGKLDLVPSVLEELGVRQVFHKVRVRPGKPLWFGVGPARPNGGPPPLVFGLPGNPVSGVVSSLLFVLPALAALAGRPPSGPRLDPWPLAEAFKHRGERATYHPVRLVGEPGQHRVEPLPWAGSPDLLTVARADGFAAFPAGDYEYPAGTSVGFLPFGARRDSNKPTTILRKNDQSGPMQ